MSVRPLCFALLLLVAVSGCLGSALNGTNGGGGGSGGNGVGGTPDMAPDVSALFYANVAPIIMPACGGCHGVTGGAGPPFMLSTPDMLKNVLGYPGLVSNPPAQSLLYSKGAHEGPAFTPAQLPVVLDWLTAYDASLAVDAGVAKPQVTPFAPSFTGTNTVDLSVLDATLAGQKLTFSAKMVGTSIELSDITLVTPDRKSVV